MSTASKLTLAGAFVFTTLTIFGVHYQQHKEHEDMYKGVIRDDKRRLEKMRKREAELAESLKTREIYEKVQTVSSEHHSKDAL